MRTTTIFLVELPEAARNCAQRAATQVFPQANLVRVATVKEAVQQAKFGSRQILLLTDLDEMEVALATQAVDADEMPLWAVLVIGRTPTDVAEFVPLEECTPQRLARLFRSVLMQHELLRENLQLRGDLKTLARRLSHDLRSPLGCLHLSCELMDETLKESNPSLKTQVGAMRESLYDISRLIDRYVDVIKASTEPVPAVEMAMEPIVNSVLDRHRGVIQQKNLTMEQTANWPTALGVAAWLEVVWSNLLGNALHHAKSSTSIQLGAASTGEEVRFWLANHGAGVPTESAGQLFPHFNRLHAQTRHGLGLSVVERLVSLQGGNCGYERRGADTSLFYFTLPANSRHP